MERCCGPGWLRADDDDNDDTALTLVDMGSSGVLWLIKLVQVFFTHGVPVLM